MERIEVGVLVFEGGSLVGDNDLARSMLRSNQLNKPSSHDNGGRLLQGALTRSSSLPLFSTLQDLLFELLGTLLVFLVPFVAKFTNPLQEVIHVFRAI